VEKIVGDAEEIQYLTCGYRHNNMIVKDCATLEGKISSPQTASNKTYN
jgi:hypothetical protein